MENESLLFCHFEYLTSEQNYQSENFVAYTQVIFLGFYLQNAEKNRRQLRKLKIEPSSEQ